MITYRTGNIDDVPEIARLHAESWRQHYRGMLSDSFLDGPIWEDRISFWQVRMNDVSPLHYVILSEDHGELCGFSCIVAEHHSRYGALLDNLHVLPGYQGEGIGRNLMKKSAKWLKQEYPDSSMYLWVFEKNIKARNFYNKLGGDHIETITTEQVDGSKASICRYVWNDVTMLGS